MNKLAAPALAATERRFSASHSVPRWQHRPAPRPLPQDHRMMLALAALCGVSTLTGLVLTRAGANAWLITLCFVTAYVSGAWFTAQDLGHALKRGTVDIHFLMIAVAFGALAVNAWTEGAILLFLFSLSNGLEQFANYRTRQSIESLLKTAPKTALRRVGGEWLEVPIEEIGPGDELLVKPGELVPVDGALIEGATAVDESALTGEALPVAKRGGDSLSGGTLNIDGQCVIRATRAMEESALSRILALIAAAQQQKAPTQRFTDSFSHVYTWVALSLSALVFVFLLLLHRPVTDAFYRAMTVLVVASPCALVLSVPSAILVAIASAARRGILFRGGVAIENLGAATRFAFDKTGTLTKGTLFVARIATFGEKSEEHVLQLAASVAHFSTHPLARAILSEAQKRRVALVETSDFINVAGFGMEATVHGERIFIGSRRFMSDRGINLPDLASTSEGEVWVGADQQALGVLFLRDEIRPAAEDVVSFLRHAGISVTLLTGDRSTPAHLVGQQVGIDDIRAELSPQAKLQCIHDWRSAGEKVAMVGDGINDAPSLAAADVSLGMGSRGSDAALEQADVVLMHDRIENVAEAFQLSRRARGIIRQNVILSLGVIAILLLSALSESINLTAGVLGHEGSTVLVILNGLRLLRSK